jgi:TolA protein
LEHRFFDVPLSAFGISLLVHLMALLLFISAPLLERVGILKKKQFSKDIYQTFIQVDVVALPDLLPGQRQSLDTSVPLVESPAHEPVPAKEETAEKKDDVMTIEESREEAKARAEAKKKAEAIEKEKVKAREKEKEKKRAAEQEKALKKLAEEAKREAAVKALQSKAGTKGRQKISGNILSKGTALKGAIGTAKDQYTGRIVQAALEQFNVYSWQQKKGLKTVIHLELYSTGKVKSRQVVQRSVDPLYDSAVLQAIDQATFPAPEDPSVLSEGFDITFIP